MYPIRTLAPLKSKSLCFGTHPDKLMPTDRGNGSVLSRDQVTAEGHCQVDLHLLCYIFSAECYR